MAGPAKQIPGRRPARNIGRWLFIIISATLLFALAVLIVPKMPWVVAILLPAFNLLPDIAGYLFAMVGISLIFMSEELKRLENRRFPRLVIAAAIFSLGLLAVISNNVQKTADKQEAQGERNKLLSALIEVQHTDDQILNLIQQISRSPTSVTKTEDLIKAWGRVSTLSSPAVRGATASPSAPPERRERRTLNAENLALSLRDMARGAATIVNDGTVEAGAFAKQLQIGLEMAGCQVGGDNIKIGDPEFFPDSLTIEISSIPASTEDHSLQEAKNLIAVLEQQHIGATLRFTDLRFPPNFMRIKVAGR